MRDWLINLPSELTETDLIEMVEGTLPAHREPIAIAALKAEPRLGLLIKQLRADREAAGGLARSVSAPAEIGERVLNVIDRRMIRELDEISQQQAQHIPVSSLTIHEPTALELIMQSAWTKRLAIAAGVLIAAGVGYLGIQAATQKGEAPSGAGTGLANVTPGPRSVSPAPGSSERAELPSAAPAQAVTASADAAPAEVEATKIATSEPASPAAMPSAPEAPAGPAQITTAIAARLAREGRLAIVIKTVNSEEVARRAQLLGKSVPVPGSVACRTLAQDKVPAQALALVTGNGAAPSSMPEVSSSGTSAIGQSAPQQAGDAGPDMSLGSIAPEIKPAPAAVPKMVSSGPAPAFLATLEPSERTLAAVKAFLESGVNAEGKSGGAGEAGGAIMRVEFRVMDMPIEQSVSLDPESILWWNAPASRWARVSSVPIVIDQSAP